MGGKLKLVCGVASRARLVNYTSSQEILGRHPPPTGDYVAFSWAEDVVSTWCLCYQRNAEIMLVSPSRIVSDIGRHYSCHWYSVRDGRQPAEAPCVDAA